MKKDITRLWVSIFCSFLGLALLILINCGGDGGSSSSEGIPCSDADGRWSGTFSGTLCRGSVSHSGTFVMNCSNCSCTVIWTNNRGDTTSGTCTTIENRRYCVLDTKDCSGNPCQINSSGTISGSSASGTYSGCGVDANGSWMGVKQ
jgi:hypothetical protein